MNPGLIALKALNSPISDEERIQLSPELLVTLANSGAIELTPEERQAIPETLLLVLDAGKVTPRREGNVKEDLKIKPSNETEFHIWEAFQLLIVERDRPPMVNSKQLVNLCLKAPDFSQRALEVLGQQLILTSGSQAQRIVEMIFDVEWELNGIREFLVTHVHTRAGKLYIMKRLRHSPSDFTAEDLQSLMGVTARRSPLWEQIIYARRNHVASFVEKLSGEPTDLSADIASLKQSVKNYGFPHEMNEILHKIDEAIDEQEDAFDQVATMRHIRSFFEKLHQHVGDTVMRRKPELADKTPLDKCGQAIDFLERKEVTTAKIKELGRCLYGILSDKDFGVHALMATRDYTRLCRNMVVEYSVTLFFELERVLATKK